jgi:hypothetical protein
MSQDWIAPQTELWFYSFDQNQIRDIKRKYMKTCNYWAKVLAVTLTVPQLKGTFKMKSKRLILSTVVALAGFLPQSNAALTVDLGTASSFAVLAYSGITDAGGASTIKGNVGLSPTTGTFIGLTAGQVNGTIYAVDAFGPLGSVNNPGLLTTAKSDLSAAYTDAAGRPVPVANAFTGTDNQLGGQTLFPGVYSFGNASTANLIGTLTLDANGDLNPVWIFQASSDLITATSSKVVFKNGATSCDVFWQVGSSATIGTYSDFAGTIMAYASIGLDTGATLHGRALAETAAVTLGHNTIDVTCIPEASSFWAGAFCASIFAWQGLVVWRRKTARA